MADTLTPDDEPARPPATRAAMDQASDEAFARQRPAPKPAKTLGGLLTAFAKMFKTNRQAVPPDYKYDHSAAGLPRKRRQPRPPSA